jgi:hypothetical protein
VTPSTELPERIDLNEIGAATVSRHLCHDPGDSIPGVDAEPHANHPALLMLPAPDVRPREETLDDLASRIQQAHVSVARASVAVIAFAVTAGRLLLKAQACVPVGSWGVWVESKCEFSVRTAQDYMRIARAFGEGLIDPQHAADFASLREVLFVLRKKRNIGKQGQESAAGDWSAYPGELVADLVAWDKARQRLVSLTKQLGDVELAGADPTSRALFRKLVRETIAALWKHGRYPHDKAEWLLQRFSKKPRDAEPVA